MARDGQRSGTPRRGVVRRLLEVRGVVGGPVRPHRGIGLVAADGTAIAATQIAAPRSGSASVLLVHGFAAHGRKPAYARLADGLAARFGVLALDLRGHGRSDGESTFGDLEALDVAAGADWLAHASGGGQVVLVGISMGGTAVVHALARGVAADAAVVVSAPALFGRTSTPPLARLDRVWRSPWRRAALRHAAGVRLRGPGEWAGLDHPVELARRIDVPLLVVHGEDDHYFPTSDATALADAVRGPATVWIEPPGFGHAEDGLSRRFGRRLGRAIDAALADGRFPDRDAADRG